MNKKTSVIIAGAITAVLLIPAMSMVYAEAVPYLGNVGPEGQTGSYTLEEALKLSQARVTKAAENKGLGSGTPYFAVDGIFGALGISTGVFGNVAFALFAKGRKGKYAAQGRG
jgi:hypothetical protein